MKPLMVAVLLDRASLLNKMTTALVPYSKQIPLTQGKFATVSYWWYDFLMQWKWMAKRHRNLWYAERTARCNKRNVTIKMHRLILSINTPSIKSDHINGNGLDNTECNLRKATQAQNSRNRRTLKTHTSIYRGVSIESKHTKSGLPIKRYKAQMRFNYKKIYIGTFPFTPEGEIDAAKAYDIKAKELHGEFSNLNFKG